MRILKIESAKNFDAVAYKPQGLLFWLAPVLWREIAIS